MERVKKLEKTGFITSYHAVLEPKKLGIGVCTFVKASLKNHNKASIERFITAIEQIEEITECHHTTGTCDFMLKVVAADIHSYQQLMLERVTNIEDIQDIESMIILSTFKDSRSLPIFI